MKPRSPAADRQLDLFQAQFAQLLNLDHPLVTLADKIDWQRFDAALEPCFNPETGALVLPTRLMVGLLYLKHAFNPHRMKRCWNAGLRTRTGNTSAALALFIANCLCIRLR